jgi:allophanate hydrolase
MSNPVKPYSRGKSSPSSERNEMKPTEAVALAYAKIRENESGAQQPIWISQVPEARARARAAALEAHPEAASLPLYGRTFAVKDNIDVAEMETTAACPAFAYKAVKTAPVVSLLESAGAILIGKTNMDQFATGLVGTRSPYGACSSIFNKDYISGGSSSGSAVAVALGQVDFALGTDTAGSGRVPAAFNNLYGLKPTRGLLSAHGVVPACRTLDCVSIFTREAVLAQRVFTVGAKPDPQDFLSRPYRPGRGASWNPARPRLGVAKRLEFFGDAEAEKLFHAALQQYQSRGATLVEFDLNPFREAANLLYSGPWVAERLAAIEDFASKHEAGMNPVVAKIIFGARKYNAVDTFRAQYRLAELQKLTAPAWNDFDAMLLPTTGTIFTHAQIAEYPIERNTQLGYYTNFVNLLDLAALAMPAGFRPNGLPFGVTLIGPAMSEASLTATALALHSHPAAPALDGHIEVAVLGAHLSGQPLNHQLTSRGAWLKETTKTAPDYRFYVLANSQPPKPGLIHEPGFAGPGIEVEIWAVPEQEFGSFVAMIPPPLGIGTVKMRDGRQVKCFLAEPFALAGASEITQLGSWRNYLAQ